MKKLIGWPVTQALYYIGHWAYLWLDAIDTYEAHDFEDDNDPRSYLFRALWRVYQGCMAASLDVNDWADLTVWDRPKEHTVLR